MTDQPTPPLLPKHPPELKSNPAVAQRISVPWERIVAVLAVVVLGLLIVATIVIVNERHQTSAQPPATAVAATLATPTLNAISNPTGLGSYTISWTPADALATSYVLQAAQCSDFTDAV